MRYELVCSIKAMLAEDGNIYLRANKQWQFYIQFEVSEVIKTFKVLCFFTHFISRTDLIFKLNKLNDILIT